ncbi:Carbohydrate sulfotransferase 15 [Chamberlinius hualienensis]
MAKDRHVDNKLSRVSNILSKRLDQHSIQHNIRLRCLPYFVIIGQVKCGTTDLFRRLELHPQIEMGMLKEPDWWTRSLPGRNGKFLHPTELPFESFVDLNGLAAIEIEKQVAENHCQNSTKPISIIGEGSVATLSDQNWRKKSDIYGQRFKQQHSTAGYLRWVVPKIKIIVLLRNPVSRLFSDYLFFDKTGLVSQEDFHNRIEQTLTLFNNCKEKFGDQSCINNREITKKFTVGLHRGLYSILLEDWLTVYSKANILIIKTEDYAADEISELRKIYQFLDIDDISKKHQEELIKINIKNKGRTNIGEMWNVTRQILTQFYQPYNIQLATMLQDEKFLWN